MTLLLFVQETTPYFYPWSRSVAAAGMMSSAEDPAVSRLREYLRIPSVHPDIDYGACVELLSRLGGEAGLESRVVDEGDGLAPGKPALLLTYPGLDPALPSILLNSHMDVVPVVRENWKYDPFEAVKVDGVIYGRGAQDMKSVGIQHLEAVRRLKENGVRLPATLHVLFIPDEEIGGEEGTKLWVQTEVFRGLNVGCVLDESTASPYPIYPLFVAERNMYSFKIHCGGAQSHGALLLPNTAGQRLRSVLDRVMDFRQREADKLPKLNSELFLGDVATVNLTIMSGGLQTNVVPPEFVATFDCRLPPHLPDEQFEEFLEECCREAGEGVFVEYLSKGEKVAPTLQDDTNPYWLAFQTSCDQQGIAFKTITCPGCTDARYYRKLGIPSFGFTPISNTPLRLHGPNECVDERDFLKGVDVFYHLLQALARVRPSSAP